MDKRKNILLITHKGYIDPEIEAEYVFRHTYKDIYTTAHTHDYYEVFLIADGRLIHNINNTSMSLRKGSLVFIRPRDCHSYERLGREDCQLINLAFLPTAMKALWQYLGEGFRPERLLNPDMPPIIALTTFETNRFKERMERLHTIPLGDKYRLRTEIRIRLLEVFAKYFSTAQPDRPEMPDWLEYLCEQMQRPENLIGGTKTLQRLAYKGKEHLCRTFKKYLGKTQTQFVNELRLNYSANELLRTNKKITDIAFDVGFENLSHFYHLFKRSYHQTPSQFRKNHRKMRVS